MSFRSSVEHIGAGLALGAAVGVGSGYVADHEFTRHGDVNTVAVENCAKIIESLIPNSTNGEALGAAIKGGCPSEDIAAFKSNPVSVVNVNGELQYGSLQTIITGPKLLSEKLIPAQRADRHNRNQALVESWAIGSVLGIAATVVYVNGMPFRRKKQEEQEEELADGHMTEPVHSSGRAS